MKRNHKPTQTQAHIMDLAQVKKQAKEEAPVFYNTAFSNVEVASEHALNVDGKLLKLSDSGFDGLRETLGIPKTFASKLKGNLEESERIDFMNTLATGISKRGDMGVTFAINPNAHSISGVSQRTRHVTMDGYFDLVEKVLDRFPQLNPNKATVTSGSVNILSDSGLDFAIPNMRDEVFKTGFAMRYNNGQVEFSSVLERQICTNLMINDVQEESFSMDALTRQSVYNFFAKLADFADNDFVPAHVVEQIKRASQTRASVREVRKVRNIIGKYGDGSREKFVPLAKTRLAYQNDGIDIDQLRARQLRGAVSGVTVWDVVNGLTDFASHDQKKNGFDFNDEDGLRMMVQAGQMLSRENYDVENFIPTPKMLLN